MEPATLAHCDAVGWEPSTASKVDSRTLVVFIRNAIGALWVPAFKETDLGVRDMEAHGTPRLNRILLDDRIKDRLMLGDQGFPSNL